MSSPTAHQYICLRTTDEASYHVPVSVAATSPAIRNFFLTHPNTPFDLKINDEETNVLIDYLFYRHAGLSTPADEL